jgi:hypothetical protein
MGANGEPANVNFPNRRFQWDDEGNPKITQA